MNTRSEHTVLQVPEPDQVRQAIEQVVLLFCRDNDLAKPSVQQLGSMQRGWLAVDVRYRDGRFLRGGLERERRHGDGLLSIEMMPAGDGWQVQHAEWLSGQWNGLVVPVAYEVDGPHEYRVVGWTYVGSAPWFAAVDVTFPEREIPRQPVQP